jgi:hypothetical protein
VVKAAVTCHRTFRTSVLARREGSVVDVLCTDCYVIQECCALTGGLRQRGQSPTDASTHKDVELRGQSPSGSRFVSRAHKPCARRPSAPIQAADLELAVVVALAVVATRARPSGPRCVAAKQPGLTTTSRPTKRAAASSTQTILPCRTHNCSRATRAGGVVQAFSFHLRQPLGH